MVNNVLLNEILNTLKEEKKYAALREKTSTDVSGYFDSLLRTMPEEDRKLIATALQKLDAALVQADEAAR